MTCLEALSKANRWRIRTGQDATDETYGFNGHFLCPWEGEMWFVRISDGNGFRHLSISNAQRKKLPDWNVLRRAKEAFFGTEDWVVQYFPPREEYINDCEWALHIWQPIGQDLPVPHFTMV